MVFVCFHLPDFLSGVNYTPVELITPKCQFPPRTKLHMPNLVSPVINGKDSVMQDHTPN